MSASTEVVAWTCVRCEVTARFMAGSEHRGLPADWTEEDGEIYCLGCRRVLAGEAAVAGDGTESPTREQMIQLRKLGTLDFELIRDPDRPDGVIAHACHTSVPAVRKARQRRAATTG